MQDLTQFYETRAGCMNNKNNWWACTL